LHFQPYQHYDIPLTEYIWSIKELLPQKHDQASVHGLLQYYYPPLLASNPLFLQANSGTKSREVNSGTFALKLGTPENTIILEYEDWLYWSYLLVENSSNHKEVNTHLQSRVLLNDLAKAIQEVVDWIKLEWEMQCKSAIGMHHGAQSGASNLVSGW
jgi:hypothetical protein